MFSSHMAASGLKSGDIEKPEAQWSGAQWSGVLVDNGLR